MMKEHSIYLSILLSIYHSIYSSIYYLFLFREYCDGPRTLIVSFENYISIYQSIILHIIFFYVENIGKEFLIEKPLEMPLAYYFHLSRQGQNDHF